MTIHGGGVRRGIGLVGKAAVLATALLLGPCFGPPLAAQTAEQEQATKPATKKARASKGETKGDKTAKPRTPSSPKTAKAPPPDKAADAQSTDKASTDKASTDKAPSKPSRKLDPAKLDLVQLGIAQAMQVDPGKLDPKSANTWVVLGLLEGAGGNLAGAKESQERAIAMGERRNKAAAAAAAILLGKVHFIGLSFMRNEARGVASFGGAPSQELTDLIRRQFEGAKASFEKAIVLYQASGRKDGMAAGYAQLGELHHTTTDYEVAQAEIGKALAINSDLQRKKEMAANYRALADAHRYDLDQAEVLLKEAAALDEALEYKEGLAKDYERLGAVSKSRGEPFEAEKFYKQALALTPRLQQSSLLSALERLYRDRNDPGQAAEMKEQANAVDKESGAGGRLVFSASLGLYQSGVATKNQTEALEMVVPLEKKLGHWVGLATSYTLLGMHYANRAESDEGRGSELEGRAEALFREAAALNRTLGREPALAYAYRQLIQIVGGRGNLAEIEATLADAHALLKGPDREKDMARLYSSLGHARSSRGDNAQACEYWRKGAQTYPSERELAETLKRSKCTDTQ